MKLLATGTLATVLVLPLVGCKSSDGVSAGDGGADGGIPDVPRTLPRDVGPDRPRELPPFVPVDADNGDYVPPVPGSLDGGSPLGVAVINVEHTAALPDPHRTKIPGVITIYSGSLTAAPTAELGRQLPMLPVALKSRMEIGGHGNSSWGSYPAKSMEWEFKNEAGGGVELPVLELPPGEDFELWACYADVSCLHNWFTFDLGREMGMWAPRTRFAEVFVNGSYNGLYLIMEMVRKDKYRVDIPKPALTAAGDISGGYIVKFNSGIGTGSQFRSASNLNWNYHYPRYTEITAAQKTYLLGFINRFEAALMSANYTDPATGWKSMVDLQSFVDNSIVQELSNNPDAYWRSQYLYKKADADGGKLYMGPLWDFDLSWGVGSLVDPRGQVGSGRPAWRYDYWTHEINATAIPKIPLQWPWIFTKIWSDPAFKNAFGCRWKELRKSIIDIPKMQARIEEAGQSISAAFTRHNAKWMVLGRGIPPLYSEGRMRTTHQAHVDHFKSWVGNRIGWLDANTTCTP